MNKFTLQELDDIRTVYKTFCNDSENPRKLTLFEESILCKLDDAIINYCEHRWENQCCGCCPSMMICEKCQIQLVQSEPDNE